jgi:hypothetical protein
MLEVVCVLIDSCWSFGVTFSEVALCVLFVCLMLMLEVVLCMHVFVGD